MFLLMVTLTGSSRGGLLGLAVFFVIGAFLLSRVDIERGRALAESPPERAN
jgi:UMF1 family MFS transporter